MARKFSLAAAIFVIAITLRFDPSAELPPHDDVYHSKRIDCSLLHFPHVLSFDPDRGFGGAFCPWPPLYDLACGAFTRAMRISVRWFPPIGFSVFGAAVAFAAGPIEGTAVAVSPYLINSSRTAAIDHWVEEIRVLPPGRVLAPWWMGHAIDVLGEHAVVIDNFGSMPDEALFARANAALRDRDFAWCRAHDIRYVVIDRQIVQLR